MKLQTIYRLSSTQAKKLLISNCELVVAVPVPPELPEDFEPKRVIGLSMPEHYQFCESAEYQTLPVMLPGFDDGESMTKGMQGVIGRILRPHELGRPTQRPVIFVECVVATMVPPSKRSKPAPQGAVSWPGKMLHNGKAVEAKVCSDLLEDSDPESAE